ncbi:VTT domain-containing protein [Ideonella sp.]|uniref:TVP38/TMEM64 family protein n=1 Tax=Ideonella sp. TaxID=1929293 RepID=UPI002B474132|nr:VTT domain-containing protein [Ideonella sp.]HJV70977.1 VTT domain-containing protein [Ideonella sp.]
MHRYIRLAAVALFLAGLWAVFEFSGLRSQFSVQAVHDSFERHLVTGLLAFAGLFALGNLVQIPGWVFLAAAVLALGRLWGGLATYVAACASCCTTFAIVRLLGADALRQLPGRLSERLFARLDAHPLQSVLVLRLLFQTVPALNVALALSGVRFRHYLAGTLLGLPLPILVYVLFLDSLARALHWPLPGG